MKLAKINCTFCSKDFFRSQRRINEANKFGWNQYCSRKCQNQARMKRVEKGCANLNCNNLISRKLAELRKSKSGRIFCSQSCAASFNNSKFPKKKPKVKICNFCGKNFTGENAFYCSAVCQHRTKIITKKKICKEIKEFYIKYKRIPLKREFHHYCAARNRFKTWNNAIKAAGFKPNPVLFAEKHIANDGHKCDSLAEKIIDDWFYLRKIKHKRKVPYPEDHSLTADFVTSNNWIEFFGLAGEVKNYDRLLKKKLMLAKKYKLPLIAIYPKDLFPINHLSKIILSAVRQNTKSK